MGKTGSDRKKRGHFLSSLSQFHKNNKPKIGLPCLPLLLSFKVVLTRAYTFTGAMQTLYFFSEKLNRLPEYTVLFPRKGVFIFLALQICSKVFFSSLSDSHQKCNVMERTFGMSASARIIRLPCAVRAMEGWALQRVGRARRSRLADLVCVGKIKLMKQQSCREFAAGQSKCLILLRPHQYKCLAAGVEQYPDQDQK